jgi:site-specific recombinase XerD
MATKRHWNKRNEFRILPVGFKHLKIIGDKLGISGVSTYTARHSYATVLKRSGANISYISESLGHSNLRKAENYLASFEKEERIKNAAFLTNFGD